MDLKTLLETVTPEIYQGLKRAIELGKWPDGRPLSSEQRELCMQAVIAYDRNLPEEQRVGYLPSKETPCESAASADSETPVKWQH